jgi:cyclophilin family peptidyl-prolyl cis-trans isomerase
MQLEFQFKKVVARCHSFIYFEKIFFTMNKGFKSVIVAITSVLIIGLLSFGDKKEKESLVEITTKFGVMKIKLYNETPLHRDNFLKLANEHFFDSVLFHRVINQFMIQGGDPDSKGAPEGTMLGEGGPGYDVPAEFVSGLYHKKGALAAAREGDDVNPDKKSSGSQFYIVQGRVFDTTQLHALEVRRLQQYRSEEFKKYMNQPENKELLGTYMQAMQNGDRLTSSDIMNKANPIIDERMEKYKYTPEQIEMYSTVGGTPHLDNSYTVFGELVEGWDVLDSISLVGVDRNNRPLEDVIMNVKVVKK